MNYAAVDEVPTWNRSTTGILWYGNVFPQGRAFGAREKSTCEAYACNNRCEKHFLGKRFHHGNKELRWGLVSMSPVWFFSASLVSVWFCDIVPVMKWRFSLEWHTRFMPQEWRRNHIRRYPTVLDYDQHVPWDPSSPFIPSHFQHFISFPSFLLVNSFLKSTYFWYFRLVLKPMMFSVILDFIAEGGPIVIENPTVN